MTEVAQTKQEAPEAPEAKKESVKPAKDKQGRSYATGRRKDSVARVWIYPGSGKIIVNGKECDAYFTRPTHGMVVRQPLKLVERDSQFDVKCTVKGGGLSGQAGAVKHGISQALTLFEPDLRGTLKKEGFLTRDARTVERKKYGLKKARRKKQWAKR